MWPSEAQNPRRVLDEYFISAISFLCFFKKILINLAVPGLIYIILCMYVCMYFGCTGSLLL